MLSCNFTPASSFTLQSPHGSSGTAQVIMSGPGARTFGRFLAERAKAAGVAYGGGGGGGRGSGGSSGGGGSPLPPGLGRILGGSGAIVALVAGGLAINASLFNGAFLYTHSLHRPNYS